MALRHCRDAGSVAGVFPLQEEPQRTGEQDGRVSAAAEADEHGKGEIMDGRATERKIAMTAKSDVIVV